MVSQPAESREASTTVSIGVIATMATPNGYIDINRRFSTLHGFPKSEDTATASYIRGSFADSMLGWDELLKQRLVVILGEPGSGKSWEFRRRTALLSELGRPAFLIELERLVSGAFSTGLAPEDYNRFQQWRKGRKTACFFWIPSMAQRFAGRRTFTPSSTRCSLPQGLPR